MYYHQYSLPRLERSTSLDRGVRAASLSRNLMDDYDIARQRTIRADSEVMNKFGRALSEVPGAYMSPRTVRGRHRVRVIEDGPLPTANLRANEPYYYEHKAPLLSRSVSFDNLASTAYGPSYSPYPVDIDYYSPRSYYDDSYYPSYGRNYYGYRNGLRYGNYYRPNYYSPSYQNYYYPRNNYYHPTNYSRYFGYTPVTRYPNVPYYYRYNVLPYLGYNANDYLRNYRRTMSNRASSTGRFVAPPSSFYTGLRQNLRGIMDKMDSHRSLIDRYSTIDMTPNPMSVEQRILDRSSNMTSRVR